VSDVRTGWVIQFKIRLNGIIRDQWYDLARKLNNATLNDEDEIALWRWSKSKSFTVKSVYEHLTSNGSGNDYRSAWKARIPEKTKLFMWLVEHKSILTKDNMLRRKWKGNPGCYIFVMHLKLLITCYLNVLSLR
jgi:hypothetical protein